jgi:hypothetical protein
MPRVLHHLDLWADDVATAAGESGGSEHSPDQHGAHDRLCLESSEGFEVEVVAGELTSRRVVAPAAASGLGCWVVRRS